MGSVTVLNTFFQRWLYQITKKIIWGWYRPNLEGRWG